MRLLARARRVFLERAEPPDERSRQVPDLATPTAGYPSTGPLPLLPSPTPAPPLPLPAPAPTPTPIPTPPCPYPTTYPPPLLLPVPLPKPGPPQLPRRVRCEWRRLLRLHNGLRPPPPPLLWALAAANASTAPVHVAQRPGAERRGRRRAKLETTRDLLEVTRALNNYTKRARFGWGRQEASTSPFANHMKRAAAPNEEFTQEQPLLRCHDKCSLDAEVAAGGVEQCTMDCALRHLHASR